MRKNLLFICLLIIPYIVCAEQTLTTAQKVKAESSVRNYFDLLSRYAAQPMGADALSIRDDIVLMFENLYNAPVYNDLLALKHKTNLSASCTIDDYLLSFGVLNDADSYTFRITYDSVVCQPLLEPSYADGYDDLNALVYVRKQIEGGGISEHVTNVIRYNLNTDKISYIEKASFSTSDEDVNFILKNHLGYSTSKLNEVAGRCYQEKKYVNAYLLYEKAAQRDDMDSQFALANMLYKRKGCTNYAEFATQNMAKFWLKKIYFKYYKNSGVRLYSGIWKQVQDMMTIVFKDEKKFRSDPEDKPFNSGLMKYKVPGKNLFGFFNHKGKMVIPTIYSSAFAFSEGLAAVSKNGKFGFIDSKGNNVIPYQYDDISPFVNGTASVIVADTIDGSIHKISFIINRKGEKISENFDYIGWRNRKSEMLMVARRGNKWGFINGLGEVKIPFIFDEYRNQSSVFSSVSDHIVSVLKNGKWGFVDVSSSEGEIIVKPQYKDVGTFSFGMAWVNDGTGMSYIDKNGNVVCGKYVKCSPFNAGGLACVKYEKDTKDAYLINKRGEIVYYCNEDEKGNLSSLRRTK